MEDIYITYNDVLSAKYGLRLGFFGSDSTEEGVIFSSEIQTQKAKNIKRFFITSINETQAPELEMTLLTDGIIPNIQKRQILAWLNSGNDFKKLVIHSPMLDQVYYMCKFREISEIKVSGQCVGFKMTVILNSPYQYGADSVVNLKVEDYRNYEVAIVNKSDVLDDYIYPIVKFTINNGTRIEITNLTDRIFYKATASQPGSLLVVKDSTNIEGKKDMIHLKDVKGFNVGDYVIQRSFIMDNLPIRKEIVVDNELKIIEGDGVFLSNFNKNWLRLKKGKNILRITVDGSVTVICPQLISVGF